MCDNIEATQSYQRLLSSTTNTRDLGGFPISAGRLDAAEQNLAQRRACCVLRNG